MIKNFETNKELTNYISGKKIKLLNAVTEGKCYLGADNQVYKIFGIDGLEENHYEIDKIITKDIIDLKSFAFPKELYVVNNKFMGYSSDYAGKDLFKSSNLNLKLICNLDFKKFSKAYKMMKSDVDKLSKNNIMMYDLPFNIIYDGNKFTGIDTCGYKKVDYNPTIQNNESYNYAIEGIFRLCYNDFDDKDLSFTDSDIDNYLKTVESKLPNRAKEYREKVKKLRK